MSQKYYTEEFKREAVLQVTQRGYSVKEVADRLGINTRSIYTWRKIYSSTNKNTKKDDTKNIEIRRLKAQLLRVTEERDILKKAMAYFAKDTL